MNQRSCVVTVALLLGASPAVRADGAVALQLERADVQGSDAEGVAIVVAGAAPGAPDRTLVRVELSLGAAGLHRTAEVVDGRFAARLGPFGKRRLLPASYAVVATVDSSVQRVDVAPALAGREVVAARREVQVGTPDEETKEREKLRRRYTALLEEVGALRNATEMWGMAVAYRSEAARQAGQGAVPARASRPIEAEWTRFTDDDFAPELATLRFDQQQVSELVVLGYFPEFDAVLAELMSTLDRWHAGFTVAIWTNLGKRPSREQLAKGGFSMPELRRNIDALAAQAYRALGLEPVPWRNVDIGNPEKAEDARGDVFRSAASKFQIEKPTPWRFDVRTSHPRMRLRIEPPEPGLAGKVVAGVEVHDHVLADSFDELARLEETATREVYAGYELKKVKRIAAPDPTMPGGIRPGQELRFTTIVDGRRFAVVHHALFCRWHKRTYVLAFLTEASQDGRHEQALETLTDSFKVLDAPHTVEER